MTLEKFQKLLAECELELTRQDLDVAREILHNRVVQKILARAWVTAQGLEKACSSKPYETLAELAKDQGKRAGILHTIELFVDAPEENN